MLSMTMADANSEPEVTKIKREMFDEDHSRLVALVDSIDKSGVDIKIEAVNGKPGYAISSYARANKSDLVVFNSPDTHLGLFDRIFTHDIEYILADMPCNLLIIHSRV
jgi:hypothetical protein